jgi:predicted nuclease of predicted toxin-antitoxin system
MNILADENIALPVVELLRQEGHNIWYTIQGKSISDEVVLEFANRQKALLLTDDKDFGEIVVRHRLTTSGVLLVRLAGLSPLRKAEIVAQVIREHGETLLNAFTVITPKKVRSRPIE